MRRKTYTDDFKKMVIEVYNTGKPIKEICEEYGVSTATLNNWTNSVQVKEKISKKPIIAKKSKATEEKSKEDSKEFAKLKKENERIKMELEILKKAIAIFSKDQEI
ncbi:Transposase [compost metagenome]